METRVERKQRGLKQRRALLGFSAEKAQFSTFSTYMTDDIRILRRKVRVNILDQCTDKLIEGFL